MTDVKAECGIDGLPFWGSGLCKAIFWAVLQPMPFHSEEQNQNSGHKGPRESNTCILAHKLGRNPFETTITDRSLPGAQSYVWPG